MNRIPRTSARTMLLAYIFAALAVASASPLLRAVAVNSGQSPFLSNFILVVFAIPAIIFALSAAYPALKLALVGASALTLTTSAAFAIGNKLFTSGPGCYACIPSATAAPVPFLITDMSTAVLLAWPMYIAIALMGAWLARPWRQVGPSEPGNCENCGYSLFGLTEPRCPECGHRFTR